MVRGFYEGTYIGKEILGFKNGHNYQFELDNNSRTYILHAYLDKDDYVDVDLNITYASEISIKKNWKLKTDDVESIKENE